MVVFSTHYSNVLSMRRSKMSCLDFDPCKQFNRNVTTLQASRAPRQLSHLSHQSKCTNQNRMRRAHQSYFPRNISTVHTHPQITVCIYIYVLCIYIQKTILKLGYQLKHGATKLLWLGMSHTYACTCTYTHTHTHKNFFKRDLHTYHRTQWWAL